MNFYTSDWHFHHKNIIQYSGRPFKTVEDMDEYLINRWNAQVTDEDTVYYFGDLAIAGTNRVISLLEKLNGGIIWVKGNHDKEAAMRKALELGLIQEYHQMGIELKRGKHVLYCTHYPTEVGVRPNKWSISGHIHERLSSHMDQINVGIDSPSLQGYPLGTLVTEDMLMSIINQRTELIKAHEYL